MFFTPPLETSSTKGPLGDFIDALSIACTTFGVFTSLGLSVDFIIDGLNRLNRDIYVTIDNQIIIIRCITLSPQSLYPSVGLKNCIQTIASVTFAFGLFIVFTCLFLDNTWYLLNSFVQSIGHYLQWIVQVSSVRQTRARVSKRQGSQPSRQLLMTNHNTGLYDIMVEVSDLANHTLST